MCFIFLFIHQLLFKQKLRIRFLTVISRMKKNSYESILYQKIDDAIDALSGSDRKEMLKVKKIDDDFSSKFTAFCDWLINIASSNNSKSESHPKATPDDVKKAKKSREIRDSTIVMDMFNKEDYNKALKLLKSKEGQLSTEVNDLIQMNSRLQKLHNQDRVIMLKQQRELSLLINRLKDGKIKCVDSDYEDDDENEETDNLKEEFQEMFLELDEIQKKIKRSKHQRNHL